VRDDAHLSADEQCLVDVLAPIRSRKELHRSCTRGR
jgi:hypothetical protein